MGGRSPVQKPSATSPCETSAIAKDGASSVNSQVGKGACPRLSANGALVPSACKPRPEQPGLGRFFRSEFYLVKDLMSRVGDRAGACPLPDLANYRMAFGFSYSLVQKGRGNGGRSPRLNRQKLLLVIRK